MAESFTCFNTFGDVIENLSQEDRARMEIAICEYGLFGNEIELEYPLNAFFSMIKEAIDNSKKARYNGNKGGRPKKEKPGVKTPSETTTKTQNEKDENQGLKPGVKTPLSKNEKPYTNLTNTNLTNTNLTKTNSAKRKRFTPPAPAEVEEFAKSLDYYSPDFDPEHFCDYYAAQGWKLANGNTMKDWHAAVRNWLKRNAPKKTEKEAKLDELYREYDEAAKRNTIHVY